MIKNSQYVPSLFCPICRAMNCECLLQDCIHQACDGSSVRDWTYSLMRCCDCGVGFITPTPESDVIQTLYSSDYDCYCHVERSRWLQRIWWKIARWRYCQVYSDSVWNRLLTAVGRTVCSVVGRTPPATIGIPLSLPQAAHILEIGFGSGDWLLQMRRCGYMHLSGIDMHPVGTTGHRCMLWRYHHKRNLARDCRLHSHGTRTRTCA